MKTISRVARNPSSGPHALYNAINEVWNGNHVPGKSRGQPVLRPRFFDTSHDASRKSCVVCRSLVERCSLATTTLRTMVARSPWPRSSATIERVLHANFTVIFFVRHRFWIAAERHRARVIKPLSAFTRSPTGYTLGNVNDTLFRKWRCYCVPTERDNRRKTEFPKDGREACGVFDVRVLKGRLKSAGISMTGRVRDVIILSL